MWLSSTRENFVKIICVFARDLILLILLGFSFDLVRSAFRFLCIDHEQHFLFLHDLTSTDLRICSSDFLGRPPYFYLTNVRKLLFLQLVISYISLLISNAIILEFDRRSFLKSKRLMMRFWRSFLSVMVIGRSMPIMKQGWDLQRKWWTSMSGL